MTEGVATQRAGRGWSGRAVAVALTAMVLMLTGTNADDRVRPAAPNPRVPNRITGSGGFPTLREAMGLDAFTGVRAPTKWIGLTRLLAVHASESNDVWGLFQSDVIGDREDLWVVPFDGTTWGSPFFTDEQGDAHEFPDWYDRFVLNPRLRVDSDGDGWSDLVEARLGTDPKNPDTDGDGVIDSQDANPQASPRALTDEERVLATAYEAWAKEQKPSYAPVVVTLPQGVDRLELHGTPWLMIVRKPEERTPLALHVGYGTTGVGFPVWWLGLPGWDSGKSARNVQGVRWGNTSHTAAKIEIGGYAVGSGSFWYTVSAWKIGDHWHAEADHHWCTDF